MTTLVDKLVPDRLWAIVERLLPPPPQEAREVVDRIAQQLAAPRQPGVFSIGLPAPSCRARPAAPVLVPGYGPPAARPGSARAATARRCWPGCARRWRPPTVGSRPASRAGRTAPAHRPARPSAPTPPPQRCAYPPRRSSARGRPRNDIPYTAIRCGSTTGVAWGVLVHRLVVAVFGSYPCRHDRDGVCRDAR
jgi:hypothetical protein